MKRKWIAGLLFGVLLTLSAVAQKPSTPEAQLGAIINQAEVGGKFEAAIPAYKKFLEDNSKNKALAAKAQYHLGLAYEKLGNTEARKAYQVVMDKYADQPAAADAKRRLTALASSSVPEAKGVSKRLCAECPYWSTITLDGRWMTNVDTGDVAVRDMSTGKETRLTKAVSPEYAKWAILSPDLRRVAYSWWSDKSNLYQLRVVANTPGSTHQVLLDNPEFSYFELIDWSRDGKSVLLSAAKPDQTWQLVWVSIQDGSVRPLKSLDWRQHQSVGNLSPDGRYIAYAALPVNPKAPMRLNEVKNTHIYILAADGSSETEVVKEAGLNGWPIWTADGSHVLFTSDRSGTFDLWSLPVQNGKAAGTASRVLADIGWQPMLGMTRSGSYLFQVADQVDYVNITGAVGGPPQVTQRFFGVGAAWSPDGRSIAFKRHYARNPETHDLVVRSLETGDERKYTTTLGSTGRRGKPQWLHDGNSIGDFISRGRGTANVPYRVDLKTGHFKPFSESLPELSPADRIAYVVRRDLKDPEHVPDRIVKLDVATGEETQILALPKPGLAFVSLSPDGRTLAVRRSPEGETHLARVSTDGTGYREIYTMSWNPRNRDNFLSWTRDSRSIVFPERHEDKWRIMRIPAEGGNPVYTGMEVVGARQLPSFEFSPDGTIAFSSQEVGRSVWIVDNVLASLK